MIASTRKTPIAGKGFFIGRKAGRPMGYPWDVWFKKKSFTLTKGIDFTCLTYSMVVQINRKAKEYGMQARTRTAGKECMIDVILTPLTKKGKKVV